VQSIKPPNLEKLHSIFTVSVDMIKHYFVLIISVSYDLKLDLGVVIFDHFLIAEYQFYPVLKSFMNGFSSQI